MLIDSAALHVACFASFIVVPCRSRTSVKLCYCDQWPGPSEVGTGEVGTARLACWIMQPAA